MSGLGNVIGVVMMVVGMLVIAYVAMLDMAHVREARWYERGLVLAPVALLLLVLGGLLAAG